MKLKILRYVKQSASSTNASDVYKSIVSVAKGAPSAEALQGQLFDLLGAEGLDLMGMVVEKWGAVKALGASATNNQPSTTSGPPQSA